MKPKSINVWTTGFLMMAIVTLMACMKESKGFVLPPGDVTQGKALFTQLHCQHCHSIADIAWTGTPGGPDPQVQLGGQTTKLKLYGELVTSIINPSHKISQKSIAEKNWTLPDGTSRMETARYNDVMTVQQLVDLVAYLQSEYKLVMPEHYYPYY